MAFPTTPILDDFNRANEEPVTGWTDVVNGFKIVSQQLVGDSANWCTGYWNAGTFGDCEVYITIVSVYATVENLWVGLINDTANEYGYSLNIYRGAGTGGADQWSLEYNDVGHDYDVLDTADQTVSAGDSIGIERIGGVLKCYYKASGGSWVEILSASHGTFTTGSYLMLGFKYGAGVWVLDNFGGGTVVSGGGATTTQSAFRFFNANGALPIPASVGTIPAIAVTGTGNNSNDTSPDVPYPAYTTGALIIQTLASDQDVAHSNPASGAGGETWVPIISDQEPGGTAGPHLSVGYYIATGAHTAGTIAWALAGTGEQWDGHCITVTSGGFYAAAPIGAISSVYATTADVDVAVMPALTATSGGGLLVVVGGVDTDPMDATFSPAGWTDKFDEDIGAVTSFCASRDTAVTTGEAISTATFGINAADNCVSVGFIINAVQNAASGRTPFASAGADVTLGVDTDYGWQFRIENTGAVSEDEYIIQYYHTQGTATWTEITGTTSIIKASPTVDFVDGADVPQYITGTGTYTTDNNAAKDTSSAVILTTGLAAGYAFEGHLNFQVVGTSVTTSDTIQLRVAYSGGGVLAGYTDTPTITVISAGTGGAAIGIMTPRSNFWGDL